MQNKQNRLKTCLQENNYIVQAYQHYGGLSGYQDYGVLGTRIKNKFISSWRDDFVNDDSDNIIEIETPNIMPYMALKASGHVDRFTDFVVYDNDGICYRADHLAKSWFKNNNMESNADKVDTWDQQTLENNINKYKMIMPIVDEYTKIPSQIKVVKKNLMFEVPSTSNEHGIDFLRPELAQGIFVNFRVCQQVLQKDPPFGIAQVGKSYRKEISPQQYTRMREFWQAEIEYFTDPLNKTHSNYDKFKDTIIPLLTSDMQTKNSNTPILISINDAVEKKLISHKLMAYFLSKIYLFVLKMGIHVDKVRFRQHMPHEMAHYASECWDLETYVNNDWLECVGCADRGSFDLQAHSFGNSLMKSKRLLSDGKTVMTYKPRLDMKIIGQRYKNLSAGIMQYFNGMSQSQLKDLKDTLFKENDTTYISIDNNICILTKDMIKIDEIIIKVQHEDYFPHVIEPSFGIDRLIYSIFEQNFWARENDDQRIVLSLPSILSPFDVAILPLSKNDNLLPLVKTIKKTLGSYGFKCHTDNSGTSIGKRYTRIDEMGIKFAITIDFDSLNDNKVTIRERDTMSQIRVDIDKILENLSNTGSV